MDFEFFFKMAVILENNKWIGKETGGIEIG